MFSDHSVHRAGTSTRLFCCMLLALPVQDVVAGQTEFDLRLDAGYEVPIKRRGDAGKRLILWLPSEHGQRKEEVEIAEALAGQGYEVWLADVLKAEFLAPGYSSMESINVEDVAGLVRHVQNKTGKSLILLTSGRGAALAARVLARLHQQPGTEQTVKTLVLLYPNLYVATPEPGQDARYIPEAALLNTSVVVLQPDRSPWVWWLDKQKAVLVKGGASVKNVVLKGVRNRFYFRPDGTKSEQELGRRLATLIHKELGE